MELVEERCRAHPNLLEALRQLGNYSDDLEKYDPRSKNQHFSIQVQNHYTEVKF